MPRPSGIIESTGQLQTKADLDFEIKFTYMVTVTATDQGSLSDMTTVIVTVANVDETPTVTGDSNINYAENGTGTVANYSAVDPENSQITWDLLGNDNSLFSISTSGVLTFNTPPDYETPGNTNNVYLVEVQASDGTNTDTQPVTVTVTNVNEPPAFTQETATRTIAENTAAGESIGAPFLATDPDAGETLTYTLDGTDATSFGIIARSSQLQTKTTLDYETKDSYTVTVTTTDSSDASDTIRVTITITDENEPPTITGDSTINYAENGAGTVAAYTADDPENGQITWDLLGNDNSLFSISTSGVLTFNTPPDYETPTDADPDNIYLVTVRASDGANTASMDVTITVTDENETSVVAGNSLIDYPENGTGPVATYTAADPEDSQITWSLSGEDSRHFSISNAGVLTFSPSSSPPDYETPTDADHNNEYLVNVLASDGANTDTQAVAVTVTNVNEPPAFAAETAARTIAENPAEKQNIGAPFLATDPDAGETLTYTLDGTDAASFGIITTSGQLQTKADLDFEEKASYTVTVTATDSSDTSDTITVTITVTDENEPPSVSGQTNVSYEENRTDTVATYIASDPEGIRITWSLSGDDAEDFAINEGVLTFRAAPNFEDPANANTDNVYVTKVEASDGSLKSELDVTVTVTGVNEAPAFAAETATRTIAENTEAGQNIGTPVSATDPDAGDSLTHTLSDADAASFSIVATTGQLQTKANLDFENKASYEVTVSVSDSKDASGNADTATDATITVTITVTNVNEPPEFPSTETGARSVAENTPAGRDIGLPVSATDQEADTLTYSLDGTDAASFRITQSTGQLQTNAALDLETKGTYTVNVLVHDGKDGSGNDDMTTDDTQAVTITLTGENDPPSVSGQTGISYEENRTDTVAIYTADDPERASITWSLSGDDAKDFIINERVLTFKTEPDFEAPADTNHDNEYLVTVRASDGDNVVTLTVMVTVTDENEPPAFNEETDARTIAEGTEAGVDIGTPVSATDPDASETLTYSLAEADTASFDIIPRSGQLQTKAALDFEIKSTYTVTVTATDQEDLSDDTRVTITVKDVGTPAPIVPTGAFVQGDPETMEISWNEPTGFMENGSLTPFPHDSFQPTSYEYRYRETGVPGWTVVPGLTSTAATITGLTGNSYYLQVRAVNTEGKSPWPEGSVTVTLNLERPEVPGTPH